MRAPIGQSFAFDASPQALFDAWTQAQHVLEWWREPGEFRAIKWHGALRPGGHWRVEFADLNGAIFCAGGEYLAVAPPGTLDFTWSPDWEEGPPVTVHFAIQPSDRGCVLAVTHGGYASEHAETENVEAWQATMARVQGYLRGRVSGS